MAEILVLEELRDLRVALVRVADVNRRVRPVERRVEVNGVVALLGVLEEDRQLGEPHVPLLDVVLAGNRPQVGDFDVFGQRHRDPVDVRKLVPRGVDGPEVRIAFHRPRRRVDRGHGLPWRHHRQLVVERPAVAVLEQRDPAVEAQVLRLLRRGFFRRILRQELLQVVGRGIGAAEVLEPPARREPAADRRAARKLGNEEGIRFGKFEGDRVVVDLLHHPVLAVDLEFEERRGVDVLVEIDVLVPEHEIVRGKRRAVGPPGTLAQVDRRRLAVVAHLPVAGEAGDDLGAGVIEGQDLVERIDPVPVLVVCRSGERPAPVAAVFSDLAQGLDHEKLGRLRQTFVDRGQLSGFHLFGQNRGLLECLRKRLGIEDDFRSLELSDQRRADLRGLRGVRGRRRLCDRRPDPIVSVPTSPTPASASIARISFIRSSLSLVMFRQPEKPAKPLPVRAFLRYRRGRSSASRERRGYRSRALDDQSVRLRLAMLGEVERRLLVRRREVEIAAGDRKLVAFGRAGGDDLA